MIGQHRCGICRRGHQKSLRCERLSKGNELKNRWVRKLTQQKRGLRRDADSYAAGVFSVEPNPGRNGFVVIQDRSPVPEVHRLSFLIDYVVVNPGGKRRQVMDERELLVKHRELTEASHSHPSRRCSNFTE